MTKTNLEIEDIFEENTYKGQVLTYSKEYFVERVKTLLQQRMNEIVGEVKALKSYQNQYADRSVDSPKIDRGEVLNIIKSVDKK